MIGIHSVMYGRVLGFAFRVAALALATAAVCLALGVRELPANLALPAAAGAAVALAPLFWGGGGGLAELAAWCVAAGSLGPLWASVALPIFATAALRTAAVATAWIALCHAPLWARAQSGRGAAGAPESASRLEPMRAALVIGLLLLGAAPAWLDPVASASAASRTAGALALDSSPLVHLAVATHADLLRAPWFYAVSTLGSSRFEYPGYASVLGADGLLALLAWLAAAVWIRRRAQTRPSHRLQSRPGEPSMTLVSSPRARATLAVVTPALLAAVLAFGAAPLRAAPQLDPHLRAQAKASIARGLDFLRQRQAPDGSWSRSVGITALDVRAFLESPLGYSEKNGKVITQPLAFILSRNHPNGSISEGDVNSAYNTSTSIMALVATNDPRYRATIDAGQRYLESVQVDEREGYTPDKPWYGGIGYSDDARPDMPNQFMALQALKASSLDPKSPVWQRAIKFLDRSQNRSESNDQKWAGNDGGFIYMPGKNTGPFQGTQSYGTETAAGLISLLYAGVDKKDPRVQDAFNWMRRHYTLDYVPGSDGSQAGIYFYYYAFAYCMQAMGQPIIVDGHGRRHNWRNDIVRKLVGLQRADGSWINSKSSLWWQDNPDLVTAWSVNALNPALK
jgi:squalene-hopene/tetraprenyl-beta-curcumene cyclase